MQEYEIFKAMENFKQIKSIEDAIRIKTPSIGLIKKEYGEENAKKYIISWIIFLDEFLDLKDKGTEFRMMQTASFILKDYYNLTIADLIVIFGRALKGKYGKFYDRLSGATIISWFEDYFEERCNTCEMISIQEHHKYKTPRIDEKLLINLKNIKP